MPTSVVTLTGLREQVIPRCHPETRNLIIESGIRIPLESSNCLVPLFCWILDSLYVTAMNDTGKALP